ncbi:MAG: hypothetical protein JWQ09_5997 [Segetibacter sp.]|nr:hypothetical protein [Segetibacter sp.]
MHNDYTPNEIKLAYEIANALKDRDSIGLHLKYARKYKEDYLRQTLAKVMAIEESKITSSRAAIYVSIIKRGDSNEYPRY